ncbi:penicillin-insensitive murein endopeptidase [Acerihabitans arboris]|uniref:Penicillin-insensitive murein endopeptidase n=1 Tax=Acerihabitans arboris TaxID=2691583 RepID=A0A845SS31_9GAMM|nr:penicillin-insensitive murein endopeptidase [Acerihabitans arboris]NDL65331.1 penicillin-insensitive murein endopeptidase [Acerihabitans arboris]
MRQWIVGLLALASVQALAAPTPWQSIDHPVPGASQAIGEFANGCIVGARPLQLQAASYQVLRPDQRRYYGHPDLLLFIIRLSNQIRHLELGDVLLVGDMAMPAGGRFSTGHASHQSGLDVDIWLQLPRQRWSAQQLLKPQPLDVVAANGRDINAAAWQPQTAMLIKLAAEDSEVTRIFVSPAIKKQLCRVAGDDRGWLHKVRPWFGHRAHMHVRLRCPADSPECREQTPPPPGDGCGAELDSWFLPPKPGAGGPPVKKTPPPLPPSCQALLDRHLVSQ